MKKGRVFLQKGLFEKPFMNSWVKTASMTMAEKLLGYLIGPFGYFALLAVVQQLIELYYTEIFYIDQIFGTGTYLVMSWVTKGVGTITGLIVAYIVEHSASSQGKIRPFLLIGNLISGVSATFLFYIPDMDNWARLLWVYVFNILFFGIGASLVALRYHLFTLCTRDQNDRNFIILLDRVSAFLIVGTAITLTVGSVLYYTMLHDHPAENWIMLIAAFSVLSIPLSIIGYFYTKERVTLENAEVDKNNENTMSISFWKQLKALATSKYWVMALLITTITLVAGNLSGYNLSTNFCTVILGATAENNYNLVYTIASGVPLGIGMLIIYSLSKKYTIRKTTIAFSIIAIVGCVLGLIVKSDFWPVVAANFIYNIGTLPGVYILNALIYSANDEVEYKHGFRPEGLVSVAVLWCIRDLIGGVFSGVYETGLSVNGYQPELGMAQPQGVINWLYFIRYIVPMIEYALIIVILLFMNIESKLPEMQSEIRRRHKEAAEARGEVWVSPEELAQIQEEEDRKAAEEARITDLKERCLKKGLDFDTENKKYLDKKAKKEKKKNR